MQYAGFWKRLYAGLIDFLIFLPTTALFIWAQSHSKTASIVSIILGYIFYHTYEIFFHAKWGKTLGKMAAGIKVVATDGFPIGWRKALLRHSVDLGLSTIGTIGSIIAVIKISDTTLAQAYVDGFMSQSWHKYISELERGNPFPHWNYLEQAWIWSELVTLLFNKKKRALHDFIAGTVVVKQ